MTKTSFGKKFGVISKVLAMAIGLTVVGSTSMAMAAFVDATGGLNQVEYPGQLAVQFSGVNYYAPFGSPCGGVPAQTIDTQKAWLSLAQSSLLSGKTIRIYFGDCSATHYITDLVLIK